VPQLVQVVITEGRVGSVRIEGARFFNPCVLLRESYMTCRGPIYESELLEDLRWLNLNPFREVDLSLTPGQRKGTTDIVYGFSGLAGGNTDAAYQTIRAGAQADYFYGRMWGERRFVLPQNFIFLARMTGQLAGGNLLPSEQLGFGGYNSVRGYNMRLVNGDSGYFGTCEIRTPSRNLFADDQLQLLAFYDRGNAWDHTLLPGQDPNIDLSSTGLGLRYVLNPEILLRVDYGWQLNKVVTLPQPNSRWHVGVVMAR
jgi:hemolysin activation/secretion protein